MWPVTYLWMPQFIRTRPSRITWSSYEHQSQNSPIYFCFYIYSCWAWATSLLPYCVNGITLEEHKLCNNKRQRSRNEKKITDACFIVRVQDITCITCAVVTFTDIDTFLRAKSLNFNALIHIYANAQIIISQPNSNKLKRQCNSCK